MKAKILLTGLVAPMVFAACTQEEAFVPQQEAGKIDLSNRPTLGKVTLGFDSQTRATLNDEGYFNSLKWTDTDAVGARIIDAPKNDYVFGSLVYPFFGYNYNINYASTNYKFEKSAGSEWTTDALMVEGNYMFYAPYNEKALYRDALKMTFPTVQNINPASEINEKADANTDAIKEFFESENTYVVGYKFLAAEGQEKIVSPTMTHIYAYPQITLKNNYTVDEDSNPSTPAVAKPITIDSIVFESNKFYKDYSIKQKGLVDALKDAYAKAEPVKDANGNVIKTGLAADEPAGSWNDATSLLKEALTSDIAEGKTQTKKITVKFTEPLTIDANGEFKFHMVMPAEEYKTNNFEAVVYLSGQKSFIDNYGDAVKFNAGVDLTYAPGKRYAKQEYNFPAGGGYEIKDATAGELATFVLTGNVDTYIAPTYIEDAADFEDYLKALNNNDADVVENAEGGFILQKDADGKPLMEIDATIVALRNKYLSNGSITFKSDMTVSGDITLDSEYKFDGKLTQKSGNLTLKEVTVAKKATFNGTATLDKTTISAEGAEFNGTATLKNSTSITGDASFKGGEITDATITGKATFKSGNTTIKTMTANSTEITDGTVTKHDQGVATIGAITLKAGTLVVDQANFIKGESVVTIGELNADGTAKTTGTLTLKKDAKINKVALNAGEIQVKANVTGAGTDFTTAWKRGTITNEGTIVIPDNGVFTVPANGTLSNDGVVTFATPSSQLVNNGAITNKANKTINVTENNGKITVAEGSSTYVKAGTAAGEIDNTAKAALFLEATCKNTVSYTFANEASTADIEALKTKMYKINKVNFNGGINFNKEIADLSETFYGVDVMVVNGGKIKVAAEVSIPVSVTTLEVNGSVEIDGFSKDYSNLVMVRPSTTINVGKKSYLTIKEISFGRASTCTNFVINVDKTLTAEEIAANTKPSSITLDNADLYVQTAVEATTKGVSTQNTAKTWNGSKWN